MFTLIFSLKIPINCGRSLHFFLIDYFDKFSMCNENIFVHQSSLGPVGVGNRGSDLENAPFVSWLLVLIEVRSCVTWTSAKNVWASSKCSEALNSVTQLNTLKNLVKYTLENLVHQYWKWFSKCKAVKAFYKLNIWGSKKCWKIVMKAWRMSPAQVTRQP